MRLIIFIIFLQNVLAGCSQNISKMSDAALANAAYHYSGPASLSLITMVKNGSGTGAHTSVMINASQRIIFDPAGTVRHARLPEKGDVLFGVTPAIEDFYVRAHARKTHHVVIQTLEVPPNVAELALQKALAHGAVYAAQCSLRTSRFLASLPGFDHLPVVWFPNRLKDAFGRLEGVTEVTLHEYDEADKAKALRAYTP